MSEMEIMTTLVSPSDRVSIKKSPSTYLSLTPPSSSCSSPVTSPTSEAQEIKNDTASHLLLCQEEGSEPMEVPLSSNGLLSLSSLQTLFPRCSGIGKRNIRSGFVRLSRLEGGFLHPIDAATWGQDHYVCLFPKRPHSEDDDSEGQDSPYTDSEDEDESEGEKEVKPLKISDIVRRFTNLKAENVTQAPKRRRANDGSSVVVQKSNLKWAPPSLQSSSPPAELSHTVIVKDVPYSVDLEKVKAHFEKFGPIVSLRRHALHVRIGFATKAAWSEAVGNHSVDGCDLLAQEAMTVDEHKKTFAKNCKIFQLSPQISQWDLIEYFARFGRVKYIYKPHHINTVAYVTFAEEASALEAEAERWHYLKGTKFGVNSSARRISVAQTKPIVSRFGSMW